MLLLCYFITWSKLTPFGPRLYIVLLYIRSSNTGWCEKNLSYFPLFSNLVPPYTKLHKSVSNMKSWFISLPNKHCKQSQKTISIYFATWRRKSANSVSPNVNLWPPILIWRVWIISIRARATKKMGDVKSPKVRAKKTQKLNASLWNESLFNYSFFQWHIGALLAQKFVCDPISMSTRQRVTGQLLLSWLAHMILPPADWMVLTTWLWLMITWW